MLVQEAFPAITQNHQKTTTLRSLQQFIFNLFQNTNPNTLTKTTQIHTQIIINNLTQKNYIIVKLLQSYIALDHLKQAHKTFNQIKNPSTTSWNQIIRGYVSTDTPNDAVKVFDEMLERGGVADEYSYSYVISACARGEVKGLGEKYHGRVLVCGFGGNLFVRTSLVNFYASCGGVGDARRVFGEMGERSLVTWNTLLAGYVKCGDIDGARRVFAEMPERNVVSWTTLVSGCARNGECKEALCLLREMLRGCIELDQVILVAGLSACAEIGDLKMGKWIHSYIDRSWGINNKKRTVRLNNALLHMYAGCGVVDDAYELFKRMPVRSTVSWTTMISGFGKQGRGEDALSVFQLMESTKENRSKPDAITLLVVLDACSHSGFVEQGRHIFKNMKSIWGIEPDIEHYGSMVDLLSRAGLLDEALKLVEDMPMAPNVAIWGALLGGCRTYKNVELAFQIAQKLANFNLEDDKAAAYLVLLSNVYASAKRWKDVANVREKMVQLALKKPPGRSWAQIGGSVHEFLADDRTHMHASLIYEMLHLVTVEARLTGYKPDVYDAAHPHGTR
ncbi:tetratricopeptide-like helical domain-containing protein [Artemisia annua]|uniref:Tetratricopeptide-like helical domain-containing protein n=1 Tax=Artemisia annua TaxID=35608 RepID=A0A2U1KU60_ARTAN|nr:tetratricopeptide-like helical domain-containing protein [Artemisia annua]